MVFNRIPWYSTEPGRGGRGAPWALGPPFHPALGPWPPHLLFPGFAGNPSDWLIAGNVRKSFEIQRKYSPQGPLINTEFYTGWLDFWGEEHSKLNTSEILKTFHEIMSLDANLNFYMFHGGKN